MDILLYQHKDCHSEIAGFFLELFRGNKIYVYHNGKEGWFSYYAGLLNVDIKFVNKQFVKETPFDKVVYLTSTEVMRDIEPSFYKKDQILAVKHSARVIGGNCYLDKHNQVTLTPATSKDFIYCYSNCSSRGSDQEDLPFDFCVMGLTQWGGKDAELLRTVLKLGYRVTGASRTLDKKFAFINDHSQDIGIDVSVEDLLSKFSKSAKALSLQGTHSGAMVKISGILHLAFTFCKPIVLPQEYAENHGIKNYLLPTELNSSVERKLIEEERQECINISKKNLERIGFT